MKYLSEIGFALLFSSSFLLAQTNLIEAQNPGFESGLALWGGSGFANTSADSSNPGQGAQSAKLNANSATAYNTLVGPLITLPTLPGKSYILSVLTKQNLVGGNASFALNELNASKASIRYVWKTVTPSASWHPEFLVITPGSDTKYLRIYFKVDSGSTTGSAWWDNCRLFAVNSGSLTPAAVDPFSNSGLHNVSVNIAPLPVTTFSWNGSTFSPSALVPSVQVGTLLVGGNLSWQISAAGSTIPIFQNAMMISRTGLIAWTVDLKSISPTLPPGRYDLIINAASRDGMVIKRSAKRFNIN